MATVTIRIPAALREFLEGHERVVMEASTALEALSLLTERNAALRAHLYGPDGGIRAFIHLFVGDRDLRELEPDSELADGVEIRIVPSIAGG